MDKILKCCISDESLYVRELDITLHFRNVLKIDVNKIKTEEKLFTRLKKANVFRVSKHGYVSLNKAGIRWFEIKHEKIIELLDYLDYES